MKTKVLLLSVFACATAWAHFPVRVNLDCGGREYARWTPLQVGTRPLFRWQLYSQCADVYGVALGLPELRQQSAVVSVALANELRQNWFLQAGVGCVCERNCAVQIAPFNFTGRNYGFSAGLLNFESNFGYRSGGDRHSWLPGLQVGLFNAGGGIQLGLLNHNPQGFLKWFPIINFPWGAEEKE